MAELSITNLGVSAIQINGTPRRILIDAFNNVTKVIEVKNGDILLFTHDDNDHFYPEYIPDIKGQKIIIIGPPSIVKPLLIHNKANLDQVETLFTGNNAVPESISVDQISITCYHTTHFNGWDPIHNSYVIEFEEKRIYITGDSVLTKDLVEIVGKTDAVICNIVDGGLLKGEIQPNIAVHHCLSDLLYLQTHGQTRMIIGVHLLDCPWTVDADKLDSMISGYGFTNITIPVSTEQVITLA